MTRRGKPDPRDVLALYVAKLLTEASAELALADRIDRSVLDEAQSFIERHLDLYDVDEARDLWEIKTLVDEAVNALDIRDYGADETPPVWKEHHHPALWPKRSLERKKDVNNEI